MAPCTGSTDEQWTDPGALTITDEELTALALAADPDASVSVDAVPIRDLAGAEMVPLPSWYMPAPMAGGRRLRGWRRWLAILVVAAFLLINAYGLCSTYGAVVLA